MQASCLINDLKEAVKVSLFAGAALQAHGLNASLCLAKGTAALPGWQLAQGELNRTLHSLQPHSLVCTQAIPPCLASPVPRGALLRNQAAFWGKGRLLQVLVWDAAEKRLFSGLSCQALVD